MHPWTWVWLATLFYLPVIAGCVGYLLAAGDAESVQGHLLGESPALGLALGVAAGLPIVGLSQWLTPRVEALRRLAHTLGTMTGPLSWTMVCIVASTSALGEELLFRGVIQEHLGAELGVLLFAVAHVPFDRNLWLWPLFAVGAGVVFAVLYETSGAVLAPATAHFVINAANLHWLGRFSAASPGSARAPRRDPPPLPPNEPPRTGGPRGD